MNSIALMLMVLVAVVGLTGIVILVWGWRGRIIRHHPSCARCGYDLFGQEQPEVCPECGTDLTRRRSIRTTVRQRRRSAIIVGVVLVLASLGGTGWGIHRANSQTDWLEFAPTWALHMWIDHDDAAFLDRVLAQLTQRLISGDIDDETLRALCDDILIIQRDREQPWDYRYGDIVFTAFEQNVLPQEQWAMFLNDALPDEIIITTPVRAQPNAGASVRANDIIVRGPAGSRVRVHEVSREGGFVELDMRVRGGGWGSNYGSQSPQKMQCSASVFIPEATEAGIYPGIVTMNCTFKDEGGVFPDVIVPIDIHADIMVLPPDEPLYEVDPTLTDAAAVRALLTCTPILTLRPDIAVIGQLMVQCAPPPCHLSFRIDAIAGDRRIELRPVFWLAGMGGSEGIPLAFHRDRSQFDAIFAVIKETGVLTLEFTTDPSPPRNPINDGNWTLWDGVVRIEVPINLDEAESAPHRNPRR